MLSESETGRLLDELCGKLGLCLPSRDQQRLRQHPPADVHAFTVAVLRAEGLDPDRPDTRQLQRRVHDVVAAAFECRTHRNVRLHWLGCLHEFASPALQAMWLGPPSGMQSSFVECMCRYFDDLALHDGAEAAVREGWMRPAEASATAAFHREAHAYVAPGGDDDGRVLADPAWARVVVAAQHAWCELRVLIADRDEIEAMRGLEAKWGSIPRPPVT